MLNADLRIVGGLGDGFSADRPLPAMGAGGAPAGLYRELTAEVGRFIQQGSDAPRAAAPASAGNALSMLSPEAQWRQASVGQLAAGSSLAAPSAEEQQRFLADLTPLAQQASQRLGVAPEVLVAQAALESGWGRQPIRQADGSDSHNLFALKAGASWSGQVAEVTTTEYSQGLPVSQRAAFRSYASPAEAFDDFAKLVSGNPRYQAALNAGQDAHAYGRALQRGGYATDPAYADKLARIAAQLTPAARTAQATELTLPRRSAQP